MELSVIVPTFNEGPNVPELLRRIAGSLAGTAYEVIFVDDSTDDTPAIIASAAGRSEAPVRLLHRDEPSGGLAGAVLDGVHAAASDWCLVMDGDLQHPPEIIPDLLHRARRGDVDVVVASRYADGGTSKGLANAMRSSVSRMSTLVTKAMFPRKLHGCSDPMTGYFLLNRTSVDAEELQPRGFKILLEILARRQLRVAEVPFDFAERYAGESKASFTQGVRFLTQLTMLRFGRMSAFALVGGIGAVANVALMWVLTMLGTEYLWASLIASEITIVGNFLMLEYLVFADMRAESGLMRHRFVKSFLFNNIEALIRIQVLWLVVESTHISSVVATAILLVVAFVVRFVFHALVVYAPRRSRATAAEPASSIADELAA